MLPTRYDYDLCTCNWRLRDRNRYMPEAPHRFPLTERSTSQANKFMMGTEYCGQPRAARPILRASACVPSRRPPARPATTLGRERTSKTSDAQPPPLGASDKSDAHRNERTANYFGWAVMLGDSRATLPAGIATAAPSPASARRRFYSPATAHTSTFSCKTSTTTTRRRLTTRPTTHRCEDVLPAVGKGAERFCIGGVQNLAEGGVSTPRLWRKKPAVEEESKRRQSSSSWRWG